MGKGVEQRIGIQWGDRPFDGTDIAASRMETSRFPFPYEIVYKEGDRVTSVKAMRWVTHLTAPLLSLTQDSQEVTLAIDDRKISVQKDPHSNTWQVGEAGVLHLTRRTCYFFPHQGTFLFKADVPDRKSRNFVFTAMLHFGADMALNSGIK